jgi:predicted DNA-binding transcriptional regulator AlpA
MKLVTFDRLKPDYGVAYSRDHLRRKCAAGDFPKPVTVSSARIAWISDDIEEWIESRAKARDRDQAGSTAA